MRVIEEKMLHAVKTGRNYRSKNTVVSVDTDGIRVYLHGNCIFAVVDGVRRFSLAGWNTVTTRSRLNALGVDVRQKNFEPVFNGIVINSRAWYTC